MFATSISRKNTSVVSWNIKRTKCNCSLHLKKKWFKFFLHYGAAALKKFCCWEIFVELFLCVVLMSQLPWRKNAHLYSTDCETFSWRFVYEKSVLKCPKEIFLFIQQPNLKLILICVLCVKQSYTYSVEMCIKWLIYHPAWCGISWYFGRSCSLNQRDLNPV